MKPTPKWLLLIFACACGGEETNTTPPVLSVSITNLALLNGMIAFGDTLDSGVISPAVELYTTGDTESVVAASPGRVIRMFVNDQGDMEIHTRLGDATWIVIYDHVREPAITVGSDVGPGTRLGRIGPWGVLPDGTSIGRTELQVNAITPQGQSGLAYCPLDFGTTAFNAALEQAGASLTPAVSPCRTRNPIQP